MWLSLLSVLANKRQAVWDTDLKAVRGGSSVRQTGLLLGDPLFSKELENMGRQLAGRLYVCLLLHVWLCCICVCQLKLMIITTGKSDQMEFWKIKQVHTHTFTHTAWPSPGMRMHYFLWTFQDFIPSLTFLWEWHLCCVVRLVYFYVRLWFVWCLGDSEILMEDSDVSLDGNLRSTSAHRWFSPAGWCRLQEVCLRCLRGLLKAFICINFTLLLILLA